MWILVRGSDELIRRPHNGVRTKPCTVLQHHLETTGTAEALYRRRRNGQHARILDHGKTLTQVGQCCVRVYAGNFMVIERGQAGKNRPGIRRYRRCRRIEARERRNVLNAARIQDDIGRLFHDLLCPRERRSGRKLNNGDQVSLVLLRNETCLRPPELQPGNSNQRNVDHEHNGHSSHQPAAQIPIPVRQPLKAAIKPAKTGRRKRLTRPCDEAPCGSWSLKSTAQRAGLKVSETKHEMTVDAAIVTANCRKKSPEIPERNADGTKTAHNVSAIEISAPPTSSIVL